MSEILAGQSKLEMCIAKNSHSYQKKWLDDFRLQQIQQFLQKGLPTRQDELWKYTQIKETIFPDNNAYGVMREVNPAAVYLQQDNSAIRLVFINGLFSEKLSNKHDLPDNIILCPISQALDLHEEQIKPFLLREFDGERFAFAKLNSGMMTDGMFLAIPKNITLDVPIHLIFIHTEQNGFITNPRNVISVAQQSQVTIIEEHVADNAQQYVTNTVTEIHAADNANVDYYKIQDNDFTATHLANIFIEQHKDSVVKTFSFAKGASLAREDLSVWQREPGSTTMMHGLYRTSQDQQHLDHHVHVDHLAAHGTSSMLYKGILDKKSRAVFNGKVFVHPQTKQINAHQANHNLLLSNDAEINTKPELEIYAEDVKCTHGATIGQLDDESLFYLLSRGIGKKEAHTLLVHAFAEEVYSQINDEKLREYIRSRMRGDDE